MLSTIHSLYLLVIANSAAWICGNATEFLFSVLLGIYIPRSEIVGSCNSIFDVLRVAKQFSTVAGPFYVLLLLNYSHSSGCGIVSHCGFDLYFPNDKLC